MADIKGGTTTEFYYTKRSLKTMSSQDQNATTKKEKKFRARHNTKTNFDKITTN